jgi:hypothetical protein
MFSGAAVCATGIAFPSGAVLHNDSGAGSASAQPAPAIVRSGGTTGPDSRLLDVGQRAARISRSLSRTAVHPAEKQAEVKAKSKSRSKSKSESNSKAKTDHKAGGQASRTQGLADQDPRTIARALLPQFGFSADQFSCLDSIYTSESGWNTHADNPTSSAYGIPQALPGSKMSSAGPDWANNPATQIRWGLGYIKSKYGSPCGALAFREGHGWY